MSIDTGSSNNAPGRKRGPGRISASIDAAPATAASPLS